ncbi:hypothetical protein J6W34_04725 [bacterium]|nr:hypothetical protein [bacterium]
MRSSDFLLLFFITYDVIITWIFFYIWWNTRKRSNEKDIYIDELHLELEKAREKCYSKIKEDNDGGKRTN